MTNHLGQQQEKGIWGYKQYLAEKLIHKMKVDSIMKLGLKLKN